MTLFTTTPKPITPLPPPTPTTTEMKSFLDEDWTGLSKRQICSSIVNEFEEQECKKQRHQWHPVFIYQHCGETFDSREERTTIMTNTNR
jgi:hypothetical protein